MKKVIIYILSVLVFPFIFACNKPTISTSQVCDSPALPFHPKTPAFESVLQKAIQNGLPSVVLLVQDSNGTYAGAMGKADIQNNISMQPCHISKVASITKIFINVLAFQLQEAGKLDLDAPINNYLSQKDLKNIQNANQVTVRQLMMHNTGIYDVIKDNGFYLDLLNNPPKHRDYYDLLKYVRGKKASFSPGEGPGYSNTNTLLLAMILDKVAEKPHWQLLQEKIIQPLGLKNTFYYYHDSLPKGKVAQGYYDLYNNGKLENLSSFNTGSGNGYTGIYSNVFDLFKFMDALLIHPSLLSNQSLNQMLTFGNEEPGNTERLLGAGIMKDFLNREHADTEYGYGHRGRDLGYSADLFYFPEKQQTMVLIVNYGTDGESKLRPYFYELRKNVVDAMMNP